ncbi:hypothetical protein M0R72_08860 [Candidatus Pacearchaeota archaeon]|nr:hypothetical protein [Candidatus Pacearchaeota archaeon]
MAYQKRHIYTAVESLMGDIHDAQTELRCAIRDDMPPWYIVQCRERLAALGTYPLLEAYTAARKSILRAQAAERLAARHLRQGRTEKAMRWAQRWEDLKAAAKAATAALPNVTE